MSYVIESEWSTIIFKSKMFKFGFRKTIQNIITVEKLINCHAIIATKRSACPCSGDP